MNSLILITVMAVVFILTGFTLLILPTKTILRWDRKTGYSLHVNAPNEEIGLKRARIFYELFGTAFIVFSLCWFIGISSDIIQRQGGVSGTDTVTNAGWITSIGTSLYNDTGQYPPPKELNGHYPNNITQVFVIFYARKNDGGKINYRWVTNNELQRQFTQEYKNGDNFVELSTASLQVIPEGKHEVYMEEDGKELAIVRFMVGE